MTMRFWKTALIMVAMAIAGLTIAGNAREARKQLESSVLVSGTVTIRADGSVREYSIDPKAPLSPAIVQFLGDTIGKWRFQPVQVNGQVVIAKVPMHLRLVAKAAGDGNYAISIASSQFGSADNLSTTDLVSQKSRRAMPQYPKTALRMGGKGTVYLVVQVGRDGSVLNIEAEQVNLRVIGNSRQMDLVRKELADASKRAVKTWTFTPPTTGQEANEPYWLVRLPVQFLMDGDNPATDSQWDTYVPGPRNTDMPWAKQELQTAGNPDALPEGGIYPLRQGATLLNPPASG